MTAKSLLHGDPDASLYMKETACVWHRDGRDINLVPDGAFFCLPCSDDEHVHHIEVHEGRVKKVRQP